MSRMYLRILYEQRIGAAEREQHKLNRSKETIENKLTELSSPLELTMKQLVICLFSLPIRFHARLPFKKNENQI